MHVRQPPDSSYYSSLTHQKPFLPTMEEDSEEAVEESFSTKPWAANNCQNTGVSLGVTWCAPRPNCDSSASSATAFRHLDKHLGSFRYDKSLPPEGLLSVFSYPGRPTVISLQCNPTVPERHGDSRINQHTALDFDDSPFLPVNLNILAVDWSWCGPCTAPSLPQDGKGRQ
ncbi:hypothetical protein FA13DRAFT_1169669 [Coprinellus micaceus]|uniref:Uncharacterized protein n=1 Tax=Coprinellus micaceus TaxID=71717 RepID=A0A4Y7SUZ5_COPMI|nr:hypothetical protein FA13DRAFT_1169669 [Coprinellus micaceus]